MHHRLAAGLASLLMAFTCHAQDGGLTPEEARHEAKHWSRTAVDDIRHAHQLIQQSYPAILDPDARDFYQWLSQGHDKAMALARRTTTQRQAWMLDSLLPMAGKIRLNWVA